MVGDITESSPPDEFDDEVPSWLEDREMRCWKVSDMRFSTLRSAISAR